MSEKPNNHLYAFQYAYTLATTGRIEADQVLHYARQWETYLAEAPGQGGVVKLSVVSPPDPSAG